jgi:hypothetical protein
MQVQRVLLVMQAVAPAFAVVRLIRLGLRRQFPWLFAYLLFSAAYLALVALLFDHKAAYMVMYSIVQPLNVCVAALAVAEMIGLIFRDYPGLKTTGKWAINGALAVSVCASVVVAAMFPAPEKYGSFFVYYELILERSAVFSLAAIIAVLMVFLSRYPLRLGRNTLVASWFFSALFLAQAAAKLIDSISPHLSSRSVDFTEVGFSSICYVGWGLLLRTADAPGPKRQPIDKLREARLLQQLELMNGVLSRTIHR